MRTEKGKIIKKLLISFILIIGFIFALSLYNNQAVAVLEIPKFPGSIGAEEANAENPIEVKEGKQYIFDRQVLWRNPNIFCVEPSVVLENGSIGTIVDTHYIDSIKSNTSNLVGEEDYKLAWIYASMGNDDNSKLKYNNYGEYLMKCKWQHVIWIDKYGTRDSFKTWTPKDESTMYVYEGYNEYISTAPTVAYRLPWVKRVEEGKPVHLAWHYYDNNGNDYGVQSALRENVLNTLEEMSNKFNIVQDIAQNMGKKEIQINDSGAKVYYDYADTELKNYEKYKDFIIVGPFAITGTRKSADQIEQIDIEYKQNGETVKKDKLSTNNDIKFIFKSTKRTWDESYSGSMANKSGTFYIIVRKEAKIGGIDNVTIHFNRTNIEAKWWDIKLVHSNNETGEQEDSQNVEYGWGRFINEPKSISVKVPNLIPPVQVELGKVDTVGTAVDGAKFSIKYSNGLEGETKTVTDGKIVFSQVQPTSPDSFTATITETFTPSGYKMLEKPIELKFTYDSNNAVWKVEKTSGPDEKVTIGTVNKDNKSGTVKISITVENKSIIEKLTLLKTSSVSGGKVEGAKFKLTLTNVASIKDYQVPTSGATQDVPKTIYVTTNKSGNIVLEDIEIADLSKNIVITIEEIEAPVGYKKIEGTITVTLKREGNGYNISETKKDSTVTDDEFKAGKVTLKNHELELNIKDIPVMNLGGIVWTEKIQTGKATAEINNQYDGENQDEALAGIKVTLYKNGKKVAETTSSDGNQKATYTNHKGNKVEVDLAKGEYMFTDITAGDDYYVVFEYDGIKYQAMTNSKEQAYTTKARDTKIAEEPNRKDFNDNTKTIRGTGEVDKSETNAGWIIEYDTEKPDKAIYKDVKNKNGELQYVEGKTYTYLSKTEDWIGTWNTDGTINRSHYAFNINCGLSKKFFDLSLGTAVKDAIVKINNNSTKYSYKYDREKINEALGGKDYDKEAVHNIVWIAESDYYYRISDYKTEENSLINKYDNTEEDDLIEVKKDTELEIYVIYNLYLNNQSTQHNATVNSVEYHYDEHYTFIEDENLKGKVEDDKENRILKINTSEFELGTDNSTKTIELTFKVNEDKDDETKKYACYENFINEAEIQSYTTENGGLVDEDSAPGNAFIKSEIRCEDDTDEAEGIQIQLKVNEERSISGKVFDTENNNSVNDVIVQLIELVEINNQQYEYIWQETVAGSNIVKTTATSGGRGETYNVSNNDGEYKFTERIIPGNYIVRFIYGDGTYFDKSIASTKATEESKNNIKTYNGEDYKSTYVDYDYNAKWYNNTKIGEKYLYEINDDTSTTDNISNAVDNEARRLKVMSYAVDVNGNKGAKLALLSKPIGTDENELKDVLDNTWMCAETLKIKMPVDTDSKENIESDSTVTNGNKPNTSNTQFNRVNLGLMERPKTKLVLEKHITGLTVRPVASGVSLIANATADINKILEQGKGDQIQLEGQKDGLFATKSGRTNRGLWYLQTDTTELAQGADAYITYTYVIKNEGEEDYLSGELITAYKEDKGKINDKPYNSYQEYLVGLEEHVKDKIKSKGFTKGEYLSKLYYTRNDNNNKNNSFNPTLVQASVEQIQEALNPKVKFVNSTTDFTKAEGSKTYNYYDIERNLKGVDIKEIITSPQGTKGKKLVQTGETLGTTTSDKNEFINDTMDTSKKLVVSVGLSASEIENGGVYDSYIAQVTRYTNAAGRRDQSTPDNLSYVHSENTDITLDRNNPDTNKKYNEEDEFWAERFTITKPTGEDKITPVQIAIITISAVAVLGVGIILIKKFVLKK